jgi:hypothetical protein
MTAPPLLASVCNVHHLSLSAGYQNSGTYLQKPSMTLAQRLSKTLVDLSLVDLSSRRFPRSTVAARCHRGMPASDDCRRREPTFQ